MVERDEVVNGSTGKTETVETIRNGKLRWYSLTEHQFETLGNVRNLNEKSERCSFCAGICATAIFAIITLDVFLSIKAIILYCLTSVSMALTIVYYIESRKDKGEAEAIYKSLKAEGLLQQEQENQQISS